MGSSNLKRKQYLLFQFITTGGFCQAECEKIPDVTMGKIDLFIQMALEKESYPLDRAMAEEFVQKQ